MYKNKPLLEKVYQFVGENFIRISQSELFMDLTSKDLSSITQHLNRATVSEIAIYEAMINWIHHDKANRKTELANLLQLVGPDKLPRDFLEDVANNSLVKKNNQCLSAVRSVITLQLKTMKLKENDTKLISIGGFDGRKKVFEAFNIQGKSNTVYPDLPDEYSYSKALKLGECIYNTGGSLDPHFMKVANKVYQLNLIDSKLEWKEMCPMNEERSSMEAAVFCYCLIVAGGISSEKTRLQSSELYIPAFKKWQPISCMNIARSAMELVACNDRLYAVGDFDGQKHLNSTERMVDLNGKWENTKSLNFSRSLFASESYNGKIFVFGGAYNEETGRMLCIAVSPEI